MKPIRRNSKPKETNLTVTREMAESYVKEYETISAEIKKLEERKKTLAGMIKAYAQEHGTKDDKGSFYCENDDFVYGAVAKYKTVQRDNIFDTLREIGREDCIAVVETVDMSLIDKYHDEGIITDDDVSKLFEVKAMSPSVTVTRKKAMPEAEMIAARIKR